MLLYTVVNTRMQPPKNRGTARFGELLREHRRRIGVTLRAFAADAGLDPAYISRIERGVIPPPKDASKAAALAATLGLTDGSAEWTALMDAAALDAGRLPEDMANNADLLDKMPLLFRTARGQTLDREELARLFDFLKDK